MTSEYVPRMTNFGMSDPIDPRRCKAGVYDSQTWRTNQCQRLARIDGWCKQHHPDAEAERRRKAEEAYERRMRCAGCANKDAEIEKLRKRCSALEDVARVLERVRIGDLDGQMPAWALGTNHTMLDEAANQAHKLLREKGDAK